MPAIRRLTKTRVLVGVLLVVSLSAAVADVTVLLYQHRQAVGQARLLCDTKLHLIGDVVATPLLQRRLSAVASLVAEWAAENPDLVSLRATTPNGFELVRIERPGPRGGIMVSGRREVRFDGALLLTLEMTERLDRETERTLANAYQIVLASIVVSALLVLALWVTFLRYAIVPLETEIARRVEVERGLKTAQAELEDKVRARTAELSGALQRLTLHIRNTPMGYIEWNAGLEVTQWNPAAEKIFGHPSAGAVGRSIVELVVPAAMRAAVEADLRSLAGASGGMSRTYANAAADGRAIRCEWYAAPLRDPAGAVIGGGALVHDVTAQLIAEKEREAGERRIQQAQRLESLGLLAGGIAHDFNNILTAVLGHADLALERVPEGSPGRENVEAMQAAARRASELSLQLLAYSGKAQFVLRPVDLGDILRKMAPLLAASVSKKTSLVYDLADRLPLIEADPAQLRQVVMNLVVNASEALGPKGGAVTLRTGTKDCDKACLARRRPCEGDREGAYVFLEVADDGCGMSEDTLDKIFDPFFSTKFYGRGLGLATVLGIVRSHKGAVKVGSAVGSGTTFQVLFPRFESPAVAEPGPAPEIPAARALRTVLLVDDEDMVRDVGTQLLENLGFAVLTARDGIEALDIFRDRQGEIALVLLDLTMPRMDGEETFRELRRIRSDVKVVLCSGFDAKDLIVRFKEGEVSGFLQKPYRMGDLASAIRSALGAPPDA